MSGAATGGGAQRTALQKLFAGPDAFPSDIKQKATYLQWAGVHLFKFIFWFASVVTVGMFAYLFFEMPSLPAPSATSGSPDTTYIRVVLAERAQVYSNFKDIVATYLLTFSLPLITTILGYIFGQKAEAREESSQ